MQRKPFDGDPIKPQVDKLMAQFSELKAGDVLMHEDIAHVAGSEYGTSRYRSVVNAWRHRLLREKNIDIAPRSGIGYFVLSENERVSYGIGDFALSVRRMGKSASRIAAAESAKLDDNHRRQQDHAVRLTQELVQSGRKVAKQIAVSGRVVTLPRPNKAVNE